MLTKLIANENMKIYRRIRTWILFAILAAALVLMAAILHSNQTSSNPDWKQALVQEDVGLQKTLSQDTSHMPAAALQQLQQNLQLNEYYIAHNIDPNLTTAWSFASTSEGLSALLMAFIVVIAGDIVATEFSTGTIKMLLTQTATRPKILLAKYLALMLYALLMTLFMFVVSLIVGSLFFGFAGAGVPTFYTDAHGHIQHMSTALYLLMDYGFLFIEIIMTATIAFMISTIFRSSTLAITISILAFLVGNTLVAALSSFSWVKYILFANLDLSQYVRGGPRIEGMTLGFSIAMLLIYFVVMNALSWLIFIKRDVAYT